MSVALPTISRLDCSLEQQPAALLTREWLVTNGLGGYASGTVLGIATRRYHGLFVPSLPAPKGRTNMLPRVDELVTMQGKTVLLAGAEYENGVLDSQGMAVLKEFRQEYLVPTWRYELDGTVLEKRIVLPHGQNTVYCEYYLAQGGPLALQLRPYPAFRMHDGPLGFAGEGLRMLTASGGRLEYHALEGAVPLKLCLRAPQGTFVLDEKLSEKVFYRIERERGYDHVEDLYSPGYFSVELSEGQCVSLVASTEPWETLEHPASAIFEAERQRLDKLLAQVPSASQDNNTARLVLAADQFLILPGTRPEESLLASIAGEEVRTVVAGYHWFTDWGRDTMISLEGLTLCTGRHREARAILRTFAHYIKDGLIPNHFPEGQKTAIYNTIDATLWYFHALDRYYQVTQDRETLEFLFPSLQSIIEHDVAGTQFGIGVDPKDGLLRGSAEGYQLTWMDAKVEGWVVTPRRGKPVEVQGLWYNALRLMGCWAEILGQSSEKYLGRANQVAESFNCRYWYAQGGHLYDVVDGEQGDDPALRPNQIFSFSLRFPVLAQALWRPVIDSVSEHLLTPVGLRSLARTHRDYKSNYFGDLRARDAAYHQGTVWAWLVGHYLDAWLRVYGEKAKARALLAGLEEELNNSGIGSISEIYDAEPPFAPRGCIAQAWSVAEVLRLLLATHEQS